ncbi:MAG: FeoA family protein [Tepidisphaeraceae bacterium]
MPAPEHLAESCASSAEAAPFCCGAKTAGVACTLNRLGVSQCGTVVSVGGDRELRRRLMEMGLCNGTKVEVVRRSPFGDPIELKLRGYCLSLRDEQAKHVSVALAE